MHAIGVIGMDRDRAAVDHVRSLMRRQIDAAVLARIVLGDDNGRVFVVEKIDPAELGYVDPSVNRAIVIDERLVAAADLDCRLAGIYRAVVADRDPSGLVDVDAVILCCAYGSIVDDRHFLRIGDIERVACIGIDVAVFLIGDVDCRSSRIDAVRIFAGHPYDAAVRDSRRQNVFRTRAYAMGIFSVGIDAAGIEDRNGLSIGLDAAGVIAVGNEIAGIERIGDAVFR